MVRGHRCMLQLPVISLKSIKATYHYIVYIAKVEVLSHSCMHMAAKPLGTRTRVLSDKIVNRDTPHLSPGSWTLISYSTPSSSYSDAWLSSVLSPTSARHFELYKSNGNCEHPPCICVSY